MSSVTLVTAGPNNVGKTALITRFCNDTFNEVSYCWHPYANLTALFWQEDLWFVASMMQEARFFLGGSCIVSLHSQLCIDRFLAAVHELQGISLCPSQQLTKILVALYNHYLSNFLSDKKPTHLPLLQTIASGNIGYGFIVSKSFCSLIFDILQVNYGGSFILARL